MILKIFTREYRVHSYQRLPDPRPDPETYIPGSVDYRPAWSFLAKDKDDKCCCIIIRAPFNRHDRHLISVDDVPIEIRPGVLDFSPATIKFASGLDSFFYNYKDKDLSVLIRPATTTEEASMGVDPGEGSDTKDKLDEIKAQAASAAMESKRAAESSARMETIVANISVLAELASRKQEDVAEAALKLQREGRLTPEEYKLFELHKIHSGNMAKIGCTLKVNRSTVKRQFDKLKMKLQTLGIADAFVVRSSLIPEKDFVPRNDRPEEHVAETTTDWRKDDSDCWATLKLFHSANTADKKAMITAYPDIQAEYDAAKAFVALNDFIGWRREVIRNNGATKTQRDAR